jgi:hypothetical protein
MKTDRTEKRENVFDSLGKYSEELGIRDEHDQSPNLFK